MSDTRSFLQARFHVAESFISVKLAPCVEHAVHDNTIIRSRQVGSQTVQRTEIYTKDYCSYCQRAKELLNLKGVAYIEYDVTRDNLLENQMRQRALRTTVPQIFIGDQHIGGCDDLFALDEQGELDPLLKSLVAAGAEPAST